MCLMNETLAKFAFILLLFCSYVLVIPDSKSSNITLCIPKTNKSLFNVFRNSFLKRNSAIFHPPMALKEIFFPCQITGKSLVTD